MAEFKDITEKLNTVHVSEPDISTFDNTENKLFSDATVKVKLSVNDSDKGDENAVTLDINVLDCTASRKNNDVSDELKSSDIPSYSHPCDGETLEEFINAETEKNNTEIESRNSYRIDRIVAEQCNSKLGIESVGSIKIDIQNNVLTDYSQSTNKWKQNIIIDSLTAKKCVLLTLSDLQDHHLKLLKQKLDLLHMKKKILQNIFNVPNNIQPKNLTNHLEQVVNDTHRVFSEHGEVFAKCKSVLETFMQIYEEKVDFKNLQKTILEQHKVHFSTLDDISHIKFLLESFLKASAGFENSIKSCLKISTEDSESKIDVLLDLIDKASFACTELRSLGNKLAKFFDCIEFCVRNMDD